MPRFFFDVTAYGKLDTDLEGLEWSDIAAAEKEAGQAALAICFDELPAPGGTGMIAIEVRDDQGHGWRAQPR